MHNKILFIAIPFPTKDLVFLVETWEKDGIGIAKTPSHSHFSTAQNKHGNIHSSTTT